MHYLIVYHGNCPDGLTASWLIKQYMQPFIESKGKATFEYIGAEAGQIKYTTASSWKDKFVYFVDIAPSDPELINQIASEANFVLILDHHETSHTKLVENVEKMNNFRYASNVLIQLNMNYCGAQLAMQHINYQCLMNLSTWFVNYVADQDLWTWKIPQSREVLAAMHLYYDQYRWTGLDRLQKETEEMGQYAIIQKLITLGTPIVEAEDREIARLVKSSVPAILTDRETKEEFKVRITHCDNPAIVSRVGSELLAEFSDIQCSLMYRYEMIKNNWKVSVRARAWETVNVAVLAEHFGGGGHKPASAFSMPNTDLGFTSFLTFSLHKENK
jgi:oligoribonuclease NrnB/cAMP/cGMP phosphodiesterase (DHH superfamily)